MHKSGFVNIVGNPNVGKSTLMNLLVGERISIATFKAQTTRHRIMGIINDADAQIVFSDPPCRIQRDCQHTCCHHSPKSCNLLPKRNLHQKR